MQRKHSYPGRFTKVSFGGGFSADGLPKNELEGMETAILAIEQESEALEALLHDPEFQAKRFAEIPEMVAKLDAAKAKAAKLYTRWEELEAIRESAAI